jgi:hypothetical protein
MKKSILVDYQISSQGFLMAGVEIWKIDLFWEKKICQSCYLTLRWQS